MWLCTKAKGGNPVATLKQLQFHGNRYKIGKIQKLGENFEKACWRVVRTAEERTYLRKYRFIKHCISVIDSFKDKQRLQNTHITDKSSTRELLERITREYNGENTSECLKKIQEHIDAIQCSKEVLVTYTPHMI